VSRGRVFGGSYLGLEELPPEELVDSRQFRHGEFVGDREAELEALSRQEERARQFIKDQKLRVLEPGSPDNAAVAGQTARLISDYAEKFIYIDKNPLRFKGEWRGQFQDRTYLRGLYDLCRQYPIGSRNQIWQTGRQVEKSTSQSGKSITLGAMIPAYKSLYVAPRFDQVTVFSSQRFKPMAEDSPELRPYVRPSKTLWQVGAKEFLNGSFYNFRSCYLSADGCRGITAHHLMIDEVQDILGDNIPVLEECQSHFGWDTGLRYRTYAGTPKTNSNPLTRRYNMSSQFEWMVLCTHCKHWNFPDDKIIGRTRYECVKCHKEIYPHLNGRWEPMNRAALNKSWGFRIPQIVVPFKTHADILEKMTNPTISRLKFFNETLGMPYDEGELVLTEADMRNASHDGGPMLTLHQLKLLALNGVNLFAGVDFGTGEGDSPSYTVLTIGHFEQDDKFKIRYMHRFIGTEIELSAQAGLIDRMLREAGVRMVMCDWGFGAQQIARMVHEYGWSFYRMPLVMQCMYVKSRKKATYDPSSHKYLVDRNQSMIDCIDAIKQRRVRFFRYEELADFVPDFVTIFIEFSETYGTTKYEHVDPDDSFHATNYAYMAAMQFRGQLAPTIVPDISNLDLDRLGY
jgi:hypothetical protein